MSASLQKDEWLVIGSAPSVTYWLPIVRGECPFATTITCNSGIKLLRPDVYVSTDPYARDNYAGLVSAEVGGTHVVPPNILKRYQPEHFVGTKCMRFACEHGANTLHLVGMDGYRSNDDYFDEERRMVLKEGALERQSHQFLYPQMRQVAVDYPDVRFMQYGDPVVVIDLPNWSTHTV